MPGVFSSVFALLLASSSLAMAGEKPQIVTIEVKDQVGAPVESAWVRLPGTEGRRNVEPLSGVWEASMLYTYEGAPVIFTKGMELNLTVSAPGYVSQNILYTVAPRRNFISIALEPMEEREIVEHADDDGGSLMIRWFERSQEDDEAGTAP
ncbi:MAG: hypothetical protein ACI8PZ_001253 [Myxococcota bacterium]|jgi:hypothetical protein